MVGLAGLELSLGVILHLRCISDEESEKKWGTDWIQSCSKTNHVDI